MPQGPIVVKNYVPTSGLTDVHAAAAIKATNGVLATVIVNVAGSGGSLTFNNCATTGAASTANQIITIAFDRLQLDKFSLWTSLAVSELFYRQLLLAAYFPLPTRKRGASWIIKLLQSM